MNVLYPGRCLNADSFSLGIYWGWGLETCPHLQHCPHPPAHRPRVQGRRCQAGFCPTPPGRQMAHCNTPQSFSKLITSATAEGALNFRRHQAEELAVSLMASTPISSPSPGLKREGVERPTTLAATQPAAAPPSPSSLSRGCAAGVAAGQACRTSLALSLNCCWDVS